MTVEEQIAAYEAELAAMVADGKSEIEQGPIKLVIENLKSLPQS